jgi:methionyl-tRNA synthetase
MSNNFFYVTTTLPYVNAKPHIGFALEIIEADVIARYQRVLGNKVVFNTGTDEHGQKIWQKAQEADVSIQKYVNQSAQNFKALKDLLNLSYTHFTRTTDKAHIAATKKFWKKAQENGDIYKAQYKIKYCVGCELEKTESELKDGRCPLHPNQELEIRQEENYFFRFSRYQQPLVDFYKVHPDFVLPEGKMKEIIAFVKQGLKDFSISRLKEKMPWGIEIPNDPDHVMYVWFDALINYISALGWPENLEQFNQYWPGIQLAGKDNLRQQAAMWQAMLMSAGLPNSKQVLINGFINVEGQKMSKSLGNIIAPQDMVTKYGPDSTRFLLISLGTFSHDMDVSWDKFDERYTADLANGLGNLCSRVAKMADNEQLNLAKPEVQISQKYQNMMDHYQLTSALDWIIDFVKQTDQYLSETKPWKLTGQEKKEIITAAVERIQQIAFHLLPFMPSTAEKIQTHFTGKVQALDPLFPRLS